MVFSRVLHPWKRANLRYVADIDFPYVPYLREPVEPARRIEVGLLLGAVFLETSRVLEAYHSLLSVCTVSPGTSRGVSRLVFSQVLYPRELAEPARRIEVGLLLGALSQETSRVSEEHQS